MTITRAWRGLAASLAVMAGTFGAAPKLPAKPPVAAPAPAKEAEKKDEVGTVEGTELARPGGGFLGLQVVNNNFVLTFYTAKKRKTEVDVLRATARWAVRYQPNDERAVLNAGTDGRSLTSAKTIKPPHAFKVFLSLFVEGQEEPVESYVVDYRE